MKKSINQITSIILIFASFFNVVGVVFLLLFIQNHNYNSIRKSFSQSKNTKSIFAFSKDNFFNNPQIKKIKEDEYLIYGNLYDIERQQTKGDSIILIAHHDEKEEKFNLTFSQIIENNSKTRFKVYQNKIEISSLYIIKNVFNIIIIENNISNTFWLNHFHQSFVSEIESPPPELLQNNL
jgi:hypothetical protein